MRASERLLSSGVPRSQVGTTLTVSRDGQPLQVFHGVPSDWCFAVGGFGGKVQLMQAHEEAGGLQPRLVLNQLNVLQVPDSDLGAGRSDVFVLFRLRLADGGDSTIASATTKTMHEAGENIAFPDELAILLPNSSYRGPFFLDITVYDDDQKEDGTDDALGTCCFGPFAYEEAEEGAADALHEQPLKGCEQPGAGGYRFPDFSINFSLAWKGAW